MTATQIISVQQRDRQLSRDLADAEFAASIHQDVLDEDFEAYDIYEEFGISRRYNQALY